MSLVCQLAIAAMLGVFVFFAGGGIAVYSEMFGDINIAQNTTVAVERTLHIVWEAYETREPPHVFVLWGSMALVAYGVLVMVYVLVKLGCIARGCHEDCDAWANTFKRTPSTAATTIESGRNLVDLDEYAEHHKKNSRL